MEVLTTLADASQLICNLHHAINQSTITEGPQDVEEDILDVSLKTEESGSGEVPIIELQKPAKQASTSKLVPERKTRQEKIESYQMISKTMPNKISDSIAYMAAVDLLPYTTVEKEGFNDLMQTVAPSYKIIGRKALAERKIPDLFLRVRETIFNLVEKAPFVAITTDCWTSIAKQPYIALKAHFITAN
nr:unnamed protein product [Callosobruchus analis]